MLASNAVVADEETPWVDVGLDSVEHWVLITEEGGLPVRLVVVGLIHVATRTRSDIPQQLVGFRQVTLILRCHRASLQNPATELFLPARLEASPPTTNKPATVLKPRSRICTMASATKLGD